MKSNEKALQQLTEISKGGPEPVMEAIMPAASQKTVSLNFSLFLC